MAIGNGKGQPDGCVFANRFERSRDGARTVSTLIINELTIRFAAKKNYPLNTNLL